MRKSIFRNADRFELLGGYLLCFGMNTMFDYSKTIDTTSYLLKNFLKQLYDYQLFFDVLLSFIVVIFHYQMIRRKRRELHCRIVVGDTIGAIMIRYLGECCVIMLLAFSISAILNVIFHLSIINNVFLLCVFLLYVVISSGQVRKYENI